MTSTPQFAGSIRRRLVLQLLVVAAVLAVLLYLSIRDVASDAVEATQDSVLGAATTTVAEQLRGAEDGVDIDIPYSAFSMLGSISDDRVFYRILIGGETVTGYDDLPLPDKVTSGLSPVFYTRPFRDTQVRIASVERSVLVDRRAVSVLVLIAQTRQGQQEIVAAMANRAAALGFGFFVVAAALSLLTATTVLRPLRRLAEAVARRGPRDLRPVEWRSPQELAPIVTALNGFVARLRGALSTTETFIAEAAHHIRTPLATVRAQAEIALRGNVDTGTRTALRQIIRSAEDCARSASQLLDHATVVYRADQRETAPFDLRALLPDIVRTLEPAAELKDIDLRLSVPDNPVTLNADPLLVESALRNLIDNAIKYTPADGAIDIILTSRTDALITVSDTGRGLGEAIPSALTARFKRGPNVADVVGSGLGLTIVQEIAALHGGRFELTSRKEGGTCAAFSLPLS